MKKLLIGLVVLIVVLIAALLIGPSFINWNNHKAEIIAAVRDATGRELAIDGDISLRIIPAPALSVNAVRLAGLPDSSSAPLLSLKALEVRVALAPLISGEIQVTSVRLIEPAINLEVLADGRANWQFETPPSDVSAGQPGAGAADVALSLDKLAVENATFIYNDRTSGLEERAEKVNLEGSAASLKGPFHFEGTALARGLPLGFDLSVDTIETGKPIGLRLITKLAGDTAQAAFTGRIEQLEDAPRLVGQVNVKTENVAALQSALLKGSEAHPILRQHLELKASLDASAKAATLNRIDLAFGPVQGGGAVTVTMGDTPTYDLALAISRLDLDRLMEDTGETESSKKPTNPDGKTASAAPTIPAIPDNIQGSVVVTIEGLRYRGGVVSQVQLDASAEGGVLRLERLSALLPGGSDLRLSGDALSKDGAPRFNGTVELASNNLRGLLNWMDVNPTNIPSGRLANMVLTSNFNLDPQQAQITKLNLRLDSTSIEGAATILLQSRPSFGLALNIDRVNLDGYMPTGTEAPRNANRQQSQEKNGEKASAPLAILETFDSNMVINVGELAYSAAPIRGISLEVGLAAGKLNIRKAMVRDLAGASLSMSGSGEGFANEPTGKAKFRLRAKTTKGLARLAGVELPVPAERLKGLTLDGDLSGGANALTFDLRSTLAGLKAKIKGNAADLAEDLNADMTLDLQHASLAALSRTFDLGIKPLARADRPLALSGSLKGGLSAMDVDLTAKAAGGEVRAKGALSEVDKTPRVDLTVDAAHQDLVKLLAAIGNEFPAGQKSPGAVKLSTKVRGSGDRFDLSDINGKVGTFELAGQAGIDLAGTRPKLSADLRAGNVVVDHFLGAASAADSQAGGGAASGGQARRGGDGRWSREAIDLGAMQTLDADIKLAAKKLEFQRYPFVEPKLHLTLADGVMQVEELTGRLFKGNVGLRATLNSRPLPALGLSVQLRGGDINQAMRTALEMDQITGLLDFTGQFQTAGSSQWDLVNALSGQAKVHSENGVIRGFDMKSFSERLGRLNKAPDFLNLVQRTFSGGETKYQVVDGTWNIKNGVAETSDMQAKLDASEATVKGRVRLPAWNMDLRAVLRLTEHRDAPDMGVHLFGPLDQPQRDLKTAQLERWLLARLGRELLGKSSKTKGLGKLLEAVTGGGRAPAPQTSQPTQVQPSQPQPTVPQPTQPQQPQQQEARPGDPTQQLIQGLFKALKK